MGVPWIALVSIWSLPCVWNIALAVGRHGAALRHHTALQKEVLLPQSFSWRRLALGVMLPLCKTGFVEVQMSRVECEPVNLSTCSCLNAWSGAVASEGCLGGGT